MDYQDLTFMASTTVCSTSFLNNMVDVKASDSHIS